MSTARTGQRGITPVSPAASTAGPARAGRWRAAPAVWVPPAVAVTVMAVLGWWDLARRNSMGNDEVATRWAALLPLPQLEHLLSHVDAVHGLYYLLMHPWMAVGTSPAVMRIPSVIAMMAAAALLVILASQLTGSGWAGLFAGLVMALTPAMSFYAQTARSYAMVYACVVGSTLALLHAMRAEAAGGADVRRRWLLYAGLVALGGYLNEMSLLVLAAHGITVLLARYGRPTVERWLAAAGGGVLVTVPLLLVSVTEHNAVSWIGYPNWPGLKLLLNDYFGAAVAAAALLAVCIVVAVLPGALAPAGGKPAPPWWRGGGICLPSVALPLLLVPAAILIAESFVLKPLYVDRYVLYGEAGAALLAGGGAYRIGQWLAHAVGRRSAGTPGPARTAGPAGRARVRALIWVPGVVVCLCFGVLQFGAQQHARTPGSRRYDYGGPSGYVGANARKGDGILFFGSFYRKARLAYPQDFRYTTDFAMAQSPLQTGDFKGTDKPFAVTGPLMLRYRRIWVVGNDPLAPKADVQARDQSIELMRDFTLIRRQQFHGILVTLWLRR